MTDVLFLGFKITLDSDSSHEIKRHLAETSLCWQSLCSQSYGFSSSHIQMWDLDHKEDWAPKKKKKTESQRIDALELRGWRRLLRVPWTARRSNQSILKKISPEYSLEGLMLKLKLQYFGHLMWLSWKRPWCWPKENGGDRGWDG